MAITPENAVALGKPISEMGPTVSLQMGDKFPFARMGDAGQGERNLHIDYLDLLAALRANTWEGLVGQPTSNTAFNSLYQQIQGDLDFLEQFRHSPVSIADPANGLYIDSNQKLGITLASNSTAGALSTADYVDFKSRVKYDAVLDEYIYDSLSAILLQGTGATLVKNDANNTITINSTGGGGSGGITRADIGEDITGISYSADTGIFSLEANYLIPTQTMFDAKVTANAPISPNTFTKISYDAKGLVVSGTTLSAGDIPDLPTSKVTGLDTALLNLNVTKLGLALNSGQIFVGSVSNVATARTLSGDATINNTGGLTLANVGTAGQYYRVTTDAKGRVISGVGTLSEADITGNISITKLAVGTGTNGQVLGIVGGVPAWTTVQGGSGPQSDGRRIYETFQQPVTGLVPGHVVRYDTAIGQWVKSDNTLEFNLARTIAIVTATGPGDSVEVTYYGYVDTSTWGLAANSRYYVSAFAGLLTTTASTTPGNFVKEVLVTQEASRGIFNPQRHFVVPSVNNTGTLDGPANSIVRGNGTFTATPTVAGTVLRWNGTTFEWATVSGTGGGITSITMTGAVTGTSTTGAITTTLATGAVATTHVQDGAITMPKIAASGTRDGTVFLRGDGTWAVPLGGGGGGPATVTITLTGAVTGTGTNGAVTSISTNAVGTTNIADNAVVGSKIAANAVSITKIAATGTPSSSTYLRGDGIWATIVGGGGGTTVVPINSLQFVNTSDLQLVGDVSAPGNTRYYGTNASGTKGWHLFPSGTSTGSFVVLNGNNTGDTALSGKVTAAELVATEAITIVGSGASAAVNIRSGIISAEFDLLIRGKGTTQETIAYLSDIAAGGGFAWPGGTNRLILGTGAGTPTASVVNSVPTWNGSAIVWAVPAGGGGGGTTIVTTTIGTTLTAPSWQGSGPYTLHIPLASASGVTAGLVSNANVTTWNAKQNALVYDPTPTNGSGNVVTSGTLFTALAAKQNTISIPTSTLMGRTTAGSGPFENISIGSGLVLSGGVLSAPGGGGGGTSINVVTIGTAGAAPGWTGSGPYTLNIPLASVASVTAGLVSKANYDAWQAKYTLPQGGSAGQYINGLGSLVTFPFIPTALEHLSNVNVGTPGAPQQGHALVWDNVSAKYILSAVSGSGSQNLATLQDVNLGTLTSSQNGYVLTYNHATGKWITAGVPGAYASASATNQALVWNGSTYAPRQITYADVSGTPSLTVGTLTLADTALASGNTFDTAWSRVQGQMNNKLGGFSDSSLWPGKKSYKVYTQGLASQPIEFLNLGGFAGFESNPGNLNSTATLFKANWSLVMNINARWNEALQKYVYIEASMPTVSVECGKEGVTLQAVPPGINFSDTWSELFSSRSVGLDSPTPASTAGNITQTINSGQYNQSKTTMYWRYDSRTLAAVGDAHPWVGGSTRGDDPFIWLHSEEVKGNNGEYLRLEQNNAGTSGGQIYFKKSRGTYTAKAVSNSGDISGLINFTHWDGGGYYNSAAIYGQLTANASSGLAPQKIVMAVRPSAGGSFVQRLTVEPDYTQALARLDINETNASTSVRPVLRFRHAAVTLPNYSTLGSVPTLNTDTVGEVKSSFYGGLVFTGYTANAGDTANSPIIFGATAGQGTFTGTAVQFNATKHDGSTSVTAIGTGERLAAFRNNGADRVVVLGNGAVGIGVTPQANLEVSNYNAGSSVSIRIKKSGHSNVNWLGQTILGPAVTTDTAADIRTNTAGGIALVGYLSAGTTNVPAAILGGYVPLTGSYTATPVITNAYKWDGNNSGVAMPANERIFGTQNNLVEMFSVYGDGMLELRGATAPSTNPAAGKFFMWIDASGIKIRNSSGVVTTLGSSGSMSFTGLPAYNDDTAAGAGGLTTGQPYRKTNLMDGDLLAIKR